MKLFKYASLALPCMVSIPATADYATALRDYETGNFSKAFVEYERLAKLGDVNSQRYLATMYARGEGVAQNWVEAYAWIALQDENSDSRLQLTPLAVSHLSSQQLQEAESLAATYALHFSKSAIEKQLFPEPTMREGECTIEGMATAKPILTTSPRYPKNAASRGIQALVTTELLVGKNGIPAHIRIASVRTNYTSENQRLIEDVEKQFIDVSIAALKKWRFEPAATEMFYNRPLKYVLNFKLEDATAEIISSNPATFNNKLSELKARAKKEDAAAQFELARIYESDGPLYLLADDPEVGKIRNQLYLKSAVNGSSGAQFKLAQRLLAGNQCAKDEKKGLFWLTLSAQNNDANAQFALAWRLYYGDGVALDKTKSKFWLEKAAENGHIEAQLRLGIYSAQMGNANLSELKRIATPSELSDGFVLLELKAIAAAWSEDWDLAEELQEKVVGIATEANFPLESYVANFTMIKEKVKPKYSGFYN